MFSDKLVEVKISRVNIEYYTNIGYKVKLGNTYKIKSSDIIKTVATRIYVICENCKNELYMKSQNYHNQLKKSGFYVCQKCNNVKSKITNIKKYGTSCPLQNIDIIKKTKETLVREYGVDNISKLESVKDDRRENFKDDNFKNKSKITWMSKYGVDNPSKSDIIKIRKEETTFKNYGVSNPSQSYTIFEKSQISGKKIKLHEIGLMYRGTYEKDFLDFCLSKDIKVEKGATIKYMFNNIKKYYHSDFYIPSLNLICEIKSNYYYDLYYDKNIAKKISTEESGFNFIFIIDKNYNKLKILI
jgi:hypothetical protein